MCYVVLTESLGMVLVFDKSEMKLLAVKMQYPGIIYPERYGCAQDSSGGGEVRLN